MNNFTFLKALLLKNLKVCSQKYPKMLSTNASDAKKYYYSFIYSVGERGYLGQEVFNGWIIDLVLLLVNKTIW